MQALPVPVVQQDLSLTNFFETCGVSESNSDYACYIYKHNLKLPKGGKIVDARTSSPLIKVDVASNDQGAKFTYSATPRKSTSPGEYAEAVRLIGSKSYQTILIYQGPRL